MQANANRGMELLKQEFNLTVYRDPAGHCGDRERDQNVDAIMVFTFAVAFLQNLFVTLQ